VVTFARVKGAAVDEEDQDENGERRKTGDEKDKFADTDDANAA
jgi:hypothetical protein